MTSDPTTQQPLPTDDVSPRNNGSPRNNLSSRNDDASRDRTTTLDDASARHEEDLLHQPAERRRAGRFYTPHATADALLARIVPHLPPPANASLVIDPACGTGHLLLAARRALLPDPAHTPEETRIAFALRLRGTDTDPHAIHLARQRLLLDLRLPHHPHLLDDLITHDDGLHAAPTPTPHGTLAGAPAPPATPPLESPAPLVLLNPPFGNAIRKETRRTDPQTAALRERFPLAAHGAFDRAWLFVERALQLAGPTGRIGLILPAAFAAAPSARRLRQAIAHTHRLAHVQALPPDTFRGTQVRTLLAVLTPREEGGDAQGGDARSWALALRDDPGLLVRTPAAWPPLCTLLTLQACAAADEAYRLRPHVREGEAGEEAFRLVTTGAIEPGLLQWGTRSQRYLGRKLQRPVLEAAAISPRRRALHEAPKLLVAGLSRVLEAAVDRTGDVAGAVAVVAGRVIPAEATGTAETPARVQSELVLLLRMEAWLNGSVARLWYRQQHAAKAMGGGSVAVGKRPLGEVPVPPALLGRPGEDAAGLWAALGEDERERWRGWWKETPDAAGWNEALAELRAVDASAEGVLAELDAVAGRAPDTVEDARERRAWLDALTAWLAQQEPGIG